MHCAVAGAGERIDSMTWLLNAVRWGTAQCAEQACRHLALGRRLASGDAGTDRGFRVALTRASAALPAPREQLWTLVYHVEGRPPREAGDRGGAGRVGFRRRRRTWWRR